MTKRSKKNDPKSLREQAALLMKQAEEIEKDRFAKVGKTVASYHQKEWKGFDLETFKKEVDTMMG